MILRFVQIINGTDRLIPVRSGLALEAAEILGPAFGGTSLPNLNIPRTL